MKKRYIVLGGYEGHNASSALMIDGKIICASHEERFSKLKNDVGMPIQSMKYCLKEAGVTSDQINEVMLCNDKFNKNGIANILLKRPALYSISDWIKENDLYWKKKLINGENIDSYFDLMEGKSRLKKIFHYYDTKQVDFKLSQKKITKIFNNLRKQAIFEHLNINKNKVKFVEHYKLHHYHAYYSSPYRGKNVFIAHLEGDGGRYNNAVSVPTNRGIKFLAGSKTADIGRLYQWITLLLGMKPYHDEYKVMGLAPYATKSEIDKSYDVLKNLFCLTKNGLCITYKNKPKDLYFSMKEKLKGHRFDGIAGALQKILEEILLKWIISTQRKTKRNILCYGGGVAMNVKANMLLQNIKKIKKIFVPISPSDESNAIGACYYSSEKYFLKNKISINNLKPLYDPYLGPSLKITNFKKLKKRVKNKKIKIINQFSSDLIASLLVKGKIIGRCVDKAEFGQRSLGNRSILANPLISDINESINKSIKYRDFWMPFCPSIMSDKQSLVINNNKKNEAKFMTMSFQMNEKYYGSVFSGFHPADNTMRPQLIKKTENYKFYEILNIFFKKTNLPYLINTSFNLHRHPVVSDEKDIIKMIDNSNLDYIILNEKLIEIKNFK